MAIAQVTENEHISGENGMSYPRKTCKQTTLNQLKKLLQEEVSWEEHDSEQALAWRGPRAHTALAGGRGAQPNGSHRE